ncbi:MAG: hypothetical protein HC874_27365 [Richelia sp. SL_2_1]|nr:hypothetical protein [Richelia sp. SL_2_1]
MIEDRIKELEAFLEEHYGEEIAFELKEAMDEWDFLQGELRVMKGDWKKNHYLKLWALDS